MKVLIACEYSGRVRNAFTRKGHTAVSVDLLPSDLQGWHYRGDVFKFLKEYPTRWDLMIAFPPCTYLSAVGAARWADRESDGLQEEAMHFFLDLWEQKIPRIAIENPAGRMSTWWRRPDQYIQPWWFGDPWVKRTGLWLAGLPSLSPTNEVEPLGPWIDGGNSRRHGTYAKDTEGSYRVTGVLGNVGRAHERAKTFQGIADAMADQWG